MSDQQVEYFAAKRIKVQTPEGVQVREAGDLVPEAASWPKLSTWMANGSIIRSDGRIVTKREERVIGDSGRIGHAPAPARETSVSPLVADMLTNPLGPVIGTPEYIQTKQEIEGLNKESIIQLARDFGLKIHKDQKKEFFVDAILKHVTAPTAE